MRDFPGKMRDFAAKMRDFWGKCVIFGENPRFFRGKSAIFGENPRILNLVWALILRVLNLACSYFSVGFNLAFWTPSLK